VDVMLGDCTLSFSPRLGLGPGVCVCGILVQECVLCLVEDLCIYRVIKTSTSSSGVQRGEMVEKNAIR